MAESARRALFPRLVLLPRLIVQASPAPPGRRLCFQPSCVRRSSAVPSVGYCSTCDAYMAVCAPGRTQADAAASPPECRRWEVALSVDKKTSENDHVCPGSKRRQWSQQSPSGARRFSYPLLRKPSLSPSGAERLRLVSFRSLLFSGCRGLALAVFLAALPTQLPWELALTLCPRGRRTAAVCAVGTLDGPLLMAVDLSRHRAGIFSSIPLSPDDFGQKYGLFSCLFTSS